MLTGRDVVVSAKQEVVDAIVAAVRRGGADAAAPLARKAYVEGFLTLGEVEEIVRGAKTSGS